MGAARLEHASPVKISQLLQNGQEGIRISNRYVFTLNNEMRRVVIASDRRERGNPMSTGFKRLLRRYAPRNDVEMVFRYSK